MKLDLPKIEIKTLKFWEEKKIFEKSLEKNKKKEKFVFYEGPPFANGLPGIHHLLARAFKDIILRYKTMQGFFVERRAGWDTHGLPTEMEAEKKLNIKAKKEIEKLGIEKFIKECKDNVFTYKKEWEEFTKRIGFWLDFKDAYITCDNSYIETLWWILKQIWEKGLLYQDYKVVPYCPRCGTSLSSHELVQGYRAIKEKSIYLKFPLKGQKNTYFLVWTTTPWTLPGNIALAVNPSLDYVKAKINSDYLILAKERTEILKEIKEKYEIVKEFKGRELKGLEYRPLYNNFIKDKKGTYGVVLADFISGQDGTGIVHIAPAFGEEDMEVGKKNNLSVLITADEEGKMITPGYGWNKMFVKNSDPLIVGDLKKRNLLFKEEIYEHEYPFCWRCQTPLIYYAKNSWFIKMTGVKKRLIENNQKINWEPEHIKKGRFGEWLEEVKDWNLSRERYWGTPLPIWECDKCKERVCIGSVKELAEKTKTKTKIKDLHRPFIDEIVFNCEKCGGVMKRVPEVADCWFDSGSMPFAQWHYPFENKNKIDKKEDFPADFISEAIDQTRGWFYTLLAISTLLDKGFSYKNVICLGLVLDAEGQKMSKSRGNIIKPREVIGRFGSDCVRFYFYTVNAAAEPKKFDFKDIQNLYGKFFDTLWQSYNFFSTYTDKKELSSFSQKELSSFLIDRWIISRLEGINSQVIKNLDKYDVVSAARLFIDFIDDLSNWYIRRSRERFKNSEKQAPQTLYYVFLKLVKMVAPFAPFFAEELYQELAGPEESVHLEGFPRPDGKLIDKKLEGKMSRVREIIARALALRAEAGLKVRQPLAGLEIKNKLDQELLELIKEEVNVKKITLGKKIKLDTRITKELKKEGMDREVSRRIQQLRKKAGLKPGDRIIIESTFEPADLAGLKKQTGSKEFKVKKKTTGEEIEINGEKHFIKIRKI